MKSGLINNSSLMLGKKTKETIHLLVDKCTAGFCKEGSKFRVGAFSFHVLIIYWGGREQT